MGNVMYLRQEKDVRAAVVLIWGPPGRGMLLVECGGHALLHQQAQDFVSSLFYASWLWRRVAAPVMGAIYKDSLVWPTESLFLLFGPPKGILIPCL